MARLHGKTGTVSVSGSAVAAVSSFSYDHNAETIEVTAMGDGTKQYLGGLIDGSGSIECKLDTTDVGSGGQADMIAAIDAGTEVDVDLLFASGTTAGAAIGLSGSCIINSYSFSQGFDEALTLTFAFQGGLALYSGA